MSGVLFYNKCRIKTDVLTNIQLTEAEEKDVNFYDYDGFRLLSYTNGEALALTELPANPAVNENLTFDEWNWTLAAIKNQINNVGGVVNIGAIYHTTDNKTHITCKPTETAPNAYICLAPSAVNAVTVDWGDGTTDTWTSTSKETKSHTYTNVTDTSVYDITISCSSGTYSIREGTQANNKKCVYVDIKLSNKVTSFDAYCFWYYYSLKYISIPNTVTSFDSRCFDNCYSLKHINLPSGVTSLGDSCFSLCRSLQSISMPSSVTSLGDSCLTQTSLHNITIPNNITSLGSNCLTQHAINSIALPNNNSFTNLSDSCFRNCYSLESITIPNSVTSIGNACFESVSSLQKVYMKPTTPPTLSSTGAIPSNANLVIYVPSGTLSAYQNATNWSSFSSKMVEYNF